MPSHPRYKLLSMHMVTNRVNWGLWARVYVSAGQIFKFQKFWEKEVRGYRVRDVDQPFVLRLT